MEEHTYGGPSAGINSGSGSNLEPVVSHSGRQSLFPLARRAKFRAARRRRRGLSPTRSLRTIELSSLSTPRTLHAGSDTVQRRARGLSARQQSRRRASRPEDSRGSGMSSRRAAASRDDPVRTHRATELIPNVVGARARFPSVQLRIQGRARLGTGWRAVSGPDARRGTRSREPAQRRVVRKIGRAHV